VFQCPNLLEFCLKLPKVGNSDVIGGTSYGVSRYRYQVFARGIETLHRKTVFTIMT